MKIFLGHDELSPSLYSALRTQGVIVDSDVVLKLSFSVKFFESNSLETCYKDLLSYLQENEEFEMSDSEGAKLGKHSIPYASSKEFLSIENLSALRGIKKEDAEDKHKEDDTSSLTSVSVPVRKTGEMFFCCTILVV